MKICPKCNHPHEKTGIYCSRSCANSRTWTDKDKKKKSDSAQGKTSWRKGLVFDSDPKRNAAISETAQKRSYERFLSGLITERSVIRRHLTALIGYKCSVCSNSEWMGKSLTLQVDHIDGNAGNNMPDNLRLICPNCHSQTKTFGARNKGKGRKARGLPLR